eukprot:6179791-Pleurochrysis_carterae.AAC.2
MWSIVAVGEAATFGAVVNAWSSARRESFEKRRGSAAHIRSAVTCTSHVETDAKMLRREQRVRKEGGGGGKTWHIMAYNGRACANRLGECHMCRALESRIIS